MSTIHSSSETTANSPTPISPFSTYSVASEETSDESPDLGAFTTVFRALNHLQPFVPRLNPHIHTEPETPNSTDAGPLSSLPTDSEFVEGSTVWNQSMLASYLTSSTSARTRSAVTITTASQHLQNNDHDIDESGEETEGELEPHTFTTPSRSHSHHSDADLSHSHSLSDGDADLGDQPTLGDLGGAFSFLAAERAKLAARDRGTGKDSSTSDGAWRNGVEPHRARKRRRKRPRMIQLLQRDQESVDQESTTHTTGTSTVYGVAGTAGVVVIYSNPEPNLETEGSSSSVDNVLATTTPSTPQRGHKHKATLDRLRHSHSTPSLHLSQIPANPQILKLRCLAHKLRHKFPEDYDRITALLTQDFSGGDSDFSDPRGPAPRPKDSLIHVFIDHSNILIGFLNYARRHTSHSGRKRRLSHAALALLLERGRPITRRCLVASSPLYQPMDAAEQLEYEVRVLERVPDSGDGQDRRPPNINGDAGRKGHNRGSSESDKGVSGGGGGGLMASGSGTLRNGRVRYREQCVDELLQLKLHQAIADADVPLPGATIVLATGDGNVGQFNDEGFLGPVRTALKKGWRVELYAWEEGLSRAWRREFGEGTSWKDKFRIVKMEDFGEDLLEAEEGL